MYAQQFPNQQQFAQPQPQQFAVPPQQGQYPQQQFQQAPQQFQQQPQVGHSPNDFPYLNQWTLIGQVFPNQYAQQGFTYKADERGGTININMKVRNQYGRQGEKLSVQYIRVVAFGPLAQQLANSLQAGGLYKVTGEFRMNKYKSNRDQQTKSVPQLVLSSFNGQIPIEPIRVLPIIEETGTQRQQQQQGVGLPQPMPMGGVPVQQFQQPPQQFQVPPQQFQAPPQFQQPGMPQFGQPGAVAPVPQNMQPGQPVNFPQPGGQQMMPSPQQFAQPQGQFQPPQAMQGGAPPLAAGFPMPPQ